MRKTRTETRRNPARGGQRGVTLVLVAMMLLVLLAMTSLAVDMGILYTARTSAQHAADAAALAGAFTFLNPIATQPGAAQQAAIKVAGSNKILGQPVTITASDVNVNITERIVEVTVSRLGTDGIATIFGRALGISRVDVRARATAQTATWASASRCVKPIYMPNTVLSSLNPTEACNAAEVLLTNDGRVTDWAKAKIAGDPCALTRPTRPNDVETQANIGAGQFFSLDFGSGADTYRCTWSSCLNEPACNADKSIIACWNEYPVKTGDMVGPTHQGVNDLIGDPADTWIGPFEYQRGDGSGVFDTSRSLGTFPVWNNCPNLGGEDIRSGTAGQTAMVIGFVELFVDGLTNSQGCITGNTNPGGTWIMVHGVNAVGCGEGGGGGGGGGGGSVATGPFSVPVRLVQNQ